MKKSQILVCFAFIIMLSFTTKNLLAQGAYININAGYALPMSTATVEELNNRIVTENSSSYEQVYLGLGQGFNFGGAFGYMFNKHLGLEAGVSYMIGNTTTITDQYNSSKTEIEFSSNMLNIKPSIVLATGNEGINPYAKFGCIIGIGSITYDYKDEDNAGTDIMKAELDGGIALGIVAALGTSFDISDRLSVFGEVNTTNMSYAPEKGLITEATFNGEDYLEDMTINDKEIDFVDEYTRDYNNPTPDDEPSKSLKIKFPYGNIGINAGVVFKI